MTGRLGTWYCGCSALGTFRGLESADLALLEQIYNIRPWNAVVCGIDIVPGSIPASVPIPFMHRFHQVGNHVLRDHRATLLFVSLCDCEQTLRLFIPRESLPDIMPSAKILLRQRPFVRIFQPFNYGLFVGLAYPTIVWILAHVLLKG